MSRMRGQQTCHRYILGTLRSNDATFSVWSVSGHILYISLCIGTKPYLNR